MRLHHATMLCLDTIECALDVVVPVEEANDGSTEQPDATAAVLDQDGAEAKLQGMEGC